MVSKDEAVTIISKCAPIAAKLAVLGHNVEITTDEEALLSKFRQDELIELLYDQEIFRQAGLTITDIINLNFLIAMDLISNMNIKSNNLDEIHT